MGSGLLFGLLLVTAISGGYLAHVVKVPRVVGYLFAGALLRLLWTLVVGAEPGGEAAQELAIAERPLGAIKDLALGLVLFSLGRVFEGRSLRTVGVGLLKIGSIGAAVTAGLVFVGVVLAALVQGVDAPLTSVLALAVLLAVASTATAPAATLFTLQEYGAKGPASDTVLGVTGISDAVCLILFQVCVAVMAAAGVLGAGGGSGTAWVGVAAGVGGSLVIGFIFGFVLTLAHAKLGVSETLLILVAGMVLLSAGQRWLILKQGVSYDFLLVALTTGAVFRNIAIDPDRLEGAVRTVGPPLFVGFFALAGFQLHLEELRELGLIGVAYVGCRALGKVWGTKLGVRLSGRAGEIDPKLGTGLLCHAAVVIGLSDYVAGHWGAGWGARSFATTVLGSAVVFEVIGPVMLKRFVMGAGEVKAVTLLRRSDTSGGGGSILTLTVGAMLRAVGLGRRKGVGGEEELRVQHLMRSNVTCIPAGARFDEVLHLVEQSTLDQFPVTDEKGRLVGVLKFSDLREIIYDPALTDLVAAADLADTNVKAVSVDTTADAVLKVFRASDAASLPVIADEEGREVVGILEQRDLLRAIGPKGRS